MAIDSIEYNEMSALAPSRLGMRNFVNDMPYRGKPMPKMEENFAELFGSKKKKRFRADVKTRLGELTADCNTVDRTIATLETDTAALIKRSATEKGKALKFTKINIEENQTALGDLKKFKLANCADVESQRKAEEQAAFEEKLTRISEEAVEKAKAESQTLESKVKSNKKLLLIGGGVVALGIVAYLIFGKK